MKQKILIVDDNEKERKEFVAALSRDFICVEARNGEEGLTKALQALPDLILTDAVMPKLDGFALCSILMQTPETAAIPVLLCTSVKTAPEEMIVGHNMGAVDYLVKPVNLRLLAAKVHSHLRKHGQGVAQETILKVPGITIDKARRTVSVSGKSVELTRKEFDLLVVLIEAKGKVLSNKVLLEQVWEEDPAIVNNQKKIKTHLSTLNKKLWGNKGSRITNIPGLGYKFD